MKISQCTKTLKENNFTFRDIRMKNTCGVIILSLLLLIYQDGYCGRNQIWMMR
jgi:hypothetical protein